VIEGVFAPLIAGIISSEKIQKITLFGKVDMSHIMALIGHLNEIRPANAIIIFAKTAVLQKMN